MERSISSLAFKGSIPEAIGEAKRQKKLLVVYISGDNPESNQLETSIWTDLMVAESLSKYCILLHITEGTTDAAHLSAIYPQTTVPCITAIGYNGVQLWQNGGFVSAEVLASTLEKAWLTLHIQETTATFLSAALASKKSELPASGAPDTALFEQGSSSRTDVSSPSTDQQAHSWEAGSLVNPEIIEENKGCERAIEEINIKVSDEASSVKVIVDESSSKEVRQSVSSPETVNEPHDSVKLDGNNSGVDHTSFSVENGSPTPEENLDVAYEEASRVIAIEASEAIKDDNLEVEKCDGLDFSTCKSNDVHLNIRLPDGASLQHKFSVTCTLGMVKDYVDENQASNIGSYDLAIPYPRKIFTEQDLKEALSKLGLFNRQALIVVPHQRANAHHKKGSPLSNQTTSTDNVSSSNGSSEGYLAFTKRILSYMNPFSYLGGAANSSNSAQEPESNMWQYSPNPTVQNNIRGTGRPYTIYSPNQTTPASSQNTSKSRQQTSSRFGSNIHTLKHDEDDSRFNDRNAFWNGNSTQYGGDNDGK